jgi:hypothetical protein
MGVPRLDPPRRRARRRSSRGRPAAGRSFLCAFGAQEAILARVGPPYRRILELCRTGPYFVTRRRLPPVTHTVGPPASDRHDRGDSRRFSAGSPLPRFHSFPWATPSATETRCPGCLLRTTRAFARSGRSSGTIPMPRVQAPSVSTQRGSWPQRAGSRAPGPGGRRPVFRPSPGPSRAGPRSRNDQGHQSRSRCRRCRSSPACGGGAQGEPA